MEPSIWIFSILFSIALTGWTCFGIGRDQGYVIGNIEGYRDGFKAGIKHGKAVQKSGRDDS